MGLGLPWSPSLAYTVNISDPCRKVTGLNVEKVKHPHHHHGCTENQRRTYRNWDFVDVAKVRGPYEGWRHVLGIDYVNCDGGCGGQHLMLPLVLPSAILRKQTARPKVRNVHQFYYVHRNKSKSTSSAEVWSEVYLELMIWFRTFSFHIWKCGNFAPQVSFKSQINQI